MSIPRTAVLFGAVIAAFGAAARADEMPDEVLLAQAEAIVGDTLGFAAGEIGGERVVRGAPYCADAVHETIQWLPDLNGGAPNRIVQSQTSRLCRDGEGRTRQEIERHGRKVVFLRDPIARESWMLDPQSKTVTKLSRGMTPEAAIDESAWREYGNRMRDWGREFGRAVARGGATPPAPPAPPPPPAVAPVPPAPPLPPTPPTPAVVGRSEREVIVMRVDGAPPDAPVPPAVRWSARAYAPRGPGVLSPLPARDIDGLRANGERTTWTIEAGRVGNERPIQIVREVWTVPELMLTVSSRDFDPRTGEIAYRLQNLRRGEPDAGSMKVPPDYKAPERKASATG